MREYRILLLAAAGPSLLLCQPALASDCKFEDPSKTISVQGSVHKVDTANSTVATLGYPKAVAINDSKRGCVAYVQAKRVSGCAAGKMASAQGTTFVVPFTPVVLLGAQSVECR